MPVEPTPEDLYQAQRAQFIMAYGPDADGFPAFEDWGGPMASLPVPSGNIVYDDVMMAAIDPELLKLIDKSENDSDADSDAANEDEDDDDGIDAEGLSYDRVVRMVGGGSDGLENRAIAQAMRDAETGNENEALSDAFTNDQNYYATLRALHFAIFSILAPAAGINPVEEELRKHTATWE